MAAEQDGSLRRRKGTKRKAESDTKIRKDSVDVEVEGQRLKGVETGWEEVEAAGVDGHAESNDIKRHEQDGKEHHKLGKNAKKRIKDDKEKAIRAAERRRLDESATPSSVTEYEQLVLASPNSSFVWIKYMAFLISLGELDNARKIAERAINAINFREDAEKFNVWVAWLNAENVYGTEESTLQLLNRALQHTDECKMYLAAVDIFDRTEKVPLVEQCLKAACRKFGDSVDVWLRAVRFRLSQGDGSAAQRTLDRAFQSLPKSHHIKMASQTGIMEFKMGNAERGRSIFEGILANYPRRLDLWSVYIDQEIARGGDQQQVRALFERATNLSLPPKKMKFLFKRYLDYEKQYGDDAGVAHVKKSAMEFVDRSIPDN